MFRRQGVTLLELLIVIIILGIALALGFPNYTVSTEEARAVNAQNNLLALYSAQQNYYNNNGSYCTSTTSPTPCNSLSNINTVFTLNIRDDGTYSYTCVGGIACTATRNNSQGQPLLTIYFNQALNLTGSGTANPQCYDPANGSAECPY